jgi:hypothetical protein
MDRFEPLKQYEQTSYANAIAAAIACTHARIHAQNTLDYYTLREEMISQYGLNGANTAAVLKEYCAKYNLYSYEVDEFEASELVKQNKPVVAT